MVSIATTTSETDPVVSTIDSSTLWYQLLAGVSLPRAAVAFFFDVPISSLAVVY